MMRRAGGLATRQTENFCFACTGFGGDSGWNGWYKSGSMYWAVGRLICFYFLTGGSYWPQTNASELHLAGSFQGHPIWPYLARPILRQKCIFGQLALLFNFCRWVWPGTYDVTTGAPCYLKASWWIQGSKSSINSHTFVGPYGVVLKVYANIAVYQQGREKISVSPAVACMVAHRYLPVKSKNKK